MTPEERAKLNPDEDWAARHSPVHPLKLHALGALTLYWNRCEVGLYVVFAGTTKIDATVAYALTHDMGDVTMCNVIKEVIGHVGHRDDEREMIVHTLKLYDINRINRNQLIHFLPARGDTGKIEFWRQKGPKIDLKPFPNELKDIRRVVEEVVALSEHLSAVGGYFMSQIHGTVRRPLPGKPVLPELLWKPPQPNQPKPKPRPESSPPKA